MSDLTKLKQEAEQVLSQAELLFSHDEVEAALDNLAAGINAKLRDKNPIVLSLMLGGIVITGRLLMRLNFPLQLEYIHATRYRGETTGALLAWERKPPPELKGRILLIVDDILDIGNTMKEVVNECKKAGAAEIYTAVLLDKEIKGPKAFTRADFTGLRVPDRYVFGYGLDYKTYLRNCDGIYAVCDR